MANGSGNVSNVVNLGGPLNTGTPGATIPTTSLANAVVLVGTVSNTTSDNYISIASCSSPASSNAQYQVPNGKTFYCTSIQLSIGTAVGNRAIQFGYGTAALGSANTATPPTGNVIYGSATGAAAGGIKTGPAGSGDYQWNMPVSFPANSYPYFRYDTSSESVCVIIVGILV